MNWLFKEEPSHYSFDALVKDKKTVWSGVRNPLAQKHLRSVKKGEDPSRVLWKLPDGVTGC
jgi:predicted RNA-binding protein with PUA-like domain